MNHFGTVVALALVQQQSGINDMVMVNTTATTDLKAAAKLLADAVLLLARIDETCKNRDHSLTAKKFVFSNHVHQAFKALLEMSMPIPVEPCNSPNKLINIQPEPVPTSKIDIFFPL